MLGSNDGRTLRACWKRFICDLELCEPEISSFYGLVATRVRLDTVAAMK